MTEQRVLSSAELQDLTNMSGTCAKRKLVPTRTSNTPQTQQNANAAQLDYTICNLKTRAVR